VTQYMYIVKSLVSGVLYIEGSIVVAYRLTTAFALAIDIVPCI